MTRYALVTFGCRVNQADSLGIEAELAAGGATPVPPDRADLIVVNTCSVTASADQGARQTIRRLHRDNPSARIVATGCYATRCPDEVAALPGVSAVLANPEKGTVPFFREIVGLRDATARFAQKSSPLAGAEGEKGTVPFSEGPCGRLLEPGAMGRTAWTLRAQTGCEERCSYCIIPTTRGASRSRPVHDVLDELERVRAAGYRAITLTGVHLGAYGRDLSPPTNLVSLLSTLAGHGHDILFRVSSLEPMDCTPDVVDLVSAHPDRFAPHFHLPLQHAADSVLRRMRRPYTQAFYAALVDGIRARMPHAAIGSDVMVGFPGESDEEFETLAGYLERSPLTHLHVFPYSVRPGTAAESLPGAVHGAVVKARAARVREISRRLQATFRASLAGTTRPALAIEDGTVAITDNYVRVPLPPGRTRNEHVMVTL